MPRNSTARKPIATVPSTTDPTTDKSKLARQIEIIKKLREHERYNKIEGFKKLIDEVRSRPWIWAVLILIVVLGVFG